MPRPHIEFVHAQNLAWENGALPGILGELDCKVLSMDDTNGSCSVILRYPAGWTRPSTEHLTSSHEFLVLDGAIEINGQHYGMDTYAYLPPGFARTTTSSENGAVILTFFAQNPETLSGNKEIEEDPNAPTIPYINLHDIEWSVDGIDPDVVRGRHIAHKRLRHNPVTGDTTFVLEASPHFHPEGWKEKELYHPCVEEMYLLSGDIRGPQGIINAGGYFWRPPNIWHGPFVSRMGYIGVFRFIGGHHINIWSEHELESKLTPAHNPVLPDYLRGIAAKPYSQTPY